MTAAQSVKREQYSRQSSKLPAYASWSVGVDFKYKLHLISYVNPK